MSAAQLAHALGGRQVGGQWMAPCPVHTDRCPSLAVRDAPDGRVLVHCHAGCSQAAIIAALRLRGLWPGREPGTARAPTGPSLPRQGVAPDLRTGAALRLWCASVSARDTPVERYLRSRGIAIAAPAVLRFHPRLAHAGGSAWPGMVALVTRGADGRRLAVHRTFLAEDGRGKAPVAPARMVLGPCRGGVVRLAEPRAVLMVGEGIETCLAAMQATGFPAWAALSTAGLRRLDLPAHVRDIVVLADGDAPGEAAASDAAWRWAREGRRVRIARPPPGLDFNDMLLGAGRTAGGRP